MASVKCVKRSDASSLQNDAAVTNGTNRCDKWPRTILGMGTKMACVTLLPIFKCDFRGNY